MCVFCTLTEEPQLFISLCIKQKSSTPSQIALHKPDLYQIRVFNYLGHMVDTAIDSGIGMSKRVLLMCIVISLTFNYAH